MSNSTLSRRAAWLVLAVAAAVVLVACAGSGGAPGGSGTAPPANPIVADHGCLAGGSVQAASAPDGAQPVDFAMLGHGTRAVILSNQSDEDLCPWLPFARKLADRGFLVVVYDYQLAPQDDVPAIASYLRAHGASAVAVMGASEGAKGSIMAATTMHPAPDAVVTLSAEAHYGGDVIADFAKKERAPILFVSAAQDGYSAAPAARLFDRVAPATVKQLDIVTGSAHGTALLARPAVVATVVSFLVAHDA